MASVPHTPPGREDWRSAPASGRPELHRLTAARGIGALTIVVSHIVLAGSLADDRINRWGVDLLQPLGVAGVSCFFALSGLVLTWATPIGTPARTMWRKRMARVYPVHVVTWAFAYLVLVLIGTSGAILKMLPSLLLVNIWFPDLEIFWGPNTPSWTLSTEVFFYALLPLLLPLAWRIPERMLLRMLALVIAATAAWAAVVGVLVPPTSPVPEGSVPFSREQYFAIVAFAPARVLDFVLGMLVARIVIAGRTPAIPRIAAYATLAACYVVARWVIPQPLGFVAAMAPAVAVGLLYAANADADRRPSWWTSRTMIWLGDISYPLYLVHWPIVFGLLALIGDGGLPLWGGALYGAIALGLSLAAAQVLHTRVEVPFYRRLRGTRPRAPATGGLAG